MKHAPVTMKLSDIVDRIMAGSSRLGSDEHWQDVIGDGPSGHAEALAVDDCDLALRLEAEWLAAHGDELWEVTWPEHVIVRRFNSDATYSPAR